MFKRSTKLTALLVAAASVASTVPAMAATKLANKEGNIENAVAFKDGKYLYEGYRTDEDDNGLYYNDGGEKDKLLDDADSFTSSDSSDPSGKYDDKYIAVFDGSDDYIVDLSTGKITDEDTLSDLKDTAETKLANKLKKTDRYDVSSNTLSNDFAIGQKVSGSKFGDVWYEYNATTAQGVRAGETADVKGYTNASGTYIDCSHEINLYAYRNEKMTKIENVGDDEDGIKVNSIEHVRTLGQDDKYIYRVIKASLTGAEAVNGKASVTESYYVQKVSKEQGDKEDDAYLPKTTETFEIAPSDILGNGDVKDAYNLLLADKGIADAKDFNGKQNGVQFVIVDGVIYGVFNDDEDTVKIVKVVLKTSQKLDKRDTRDGAKDGKVGAHVALKADDADTDIVGYGAWSIDVNGTVWALDKGEILKSVKCGDFEKVYTCDRSLDSIDVYDENNLIAWDSEGDVYTTVGEGSKAAEEEAKEIVKENVTTEPTEPAVTVKTGWDQLADGTWNLYDATGKKVTGWSNVGGTWYYMDPTTAVMKTGWVKDNGTWYYCNNSGAMQTGWVNDNGTWYYCNASGAMQTGWLNDNGTWYYLNANGSMAANTTVDGYVLGANGAWIK